MKIKSMKSITMFILLLVYSQTYGQKIYKGTLIDSQTKEALGFVNIGIVGKNIGTVSDINGNFGIRLDPTYDSDLLRISMIGYKSMEYKVSDFKNVLKQNAELQLNKAIKVLEEVVISGTELNEKVLGNITQSTSTTGGFSSNELGNEAGVYIKVKKNRKSYLKEFNAFIVKNEYGKLKFRLNVYSVKRKLPYKNILIENIFIETDIKQGNLKVDLTSYNIITEGDIIVTLEWIENLGEDGLYFSACLFCDKIISRQTSQGNWHRVGFAGLGFNLVVSQE